LTDENKTYDKSLIGKTVRLIKTNDPYTKLQAGDKGIIESIDDHTKGLGFHQIWIKWEKTTYYKNNHTLALVPEAGDKFTILEQSPEKKCKHPMGCNRKAKYFKSVTRYANGKSSFDNCQKCGIHARQINTDGMTITYS